jgi:hypothetical protein
MCFSSKPWNGSLSSMVAQSILRFLEGPEDEVCGVAGADTLLGAVAFLGAALVFFLSGIVVVRV